jgi:4-amino-4-deoxy-L-arabinose transferase-like glycosyltransferase
LSLKTTNSRFAAGQFSRDWPFLLGLALMGLVLFFYRLGAPGLMDPDEGRYAEIGREIWVLKDWLIPHLNFLPYLEKPPLVYWLTALSFGGLGYSEFAARLPSALSALGGVFLAYGLGRALWGAGPGLFGAMVLATSGGYLALGRLLTLDMPLAFFLNLAVGLGYLALSRDRRDLLPWVYLALALGVLTKGPVAVVLPGLIWAAWALVERRAQALRVLVSPRGLCLLAGLTLPWFALVFWQYPAFLRFFILEQHLGRFLSNNVVYHGRPFYYYLPILLGFMLPWSWLLPWALARKPAMPSPDRRFLLLWAGVILVFFSLSKGKLAPYILPALVPLSLLLGQQLFSLGKGGPGFFKETGLVATLAVWCLAGWAAVGLDLWPPSGLAGELAKAQILWPILPAGLVCLALIPTLVLVLRQPQILFLGALLLSLLVPQGMEKISVQRSPRELARVLQSLWQPGSALIGYQYYSQAMSFYSGQVFHLGNTRTELDFGRRLAPESRLFFDTPAAMMDFAASRSQAFFLVREQDYPKLEKCAPGKFQCLARHKDCLLLVYKGK